MLATSFYSRFRARRAGLRGKEFDQYGRILALREIMRCGRVGGSAARGLLNPVSCVRYLEFDFADAAVSQQGDAGLRVLDVSSPRLFPFWMAEKRRRQVTMINPDRADMEESRRLARHVAAATDLDLLEGVDATALPFANDCFDAATSISVIEHVADDGDAKMIAELVRIVRPGGRIVLTFPVKPKFEIEFRDRDYYGLQSAEGAAERYFFQRFYDEEAISARLLAQLKAVETERRYFVEDPPGWFQDYERQWMRDGLALTVSDPWLIARRFRDAGAAHPTDRLGICGLSLTVTNEKDAAA